MRPTGGPMSYSETETEVLRRFFEKCRIAGGAKAGYNLRRQAIELGVSGQAAEGLDEGLASLVEKGLLASNEAGDRFILTESGVEALDTA
jgi:hypothetical protein